MPRLLANRSKVIRALLWEQWRQTRLTLAATLCVALASAAAVYMIRKSEPILVKITPVEGWFFILPFFALFALPLTQSERNRVSPCLPPRLLALPVSTGKLVGAYFGFRLVAVAVLSIAVSWLAQVALGSGHRLEPLMLQDFGGPMAWPPLVIAAYAFIQALLWVLGPINFGVAVATTFLLGIPLMNRFISLISEKGAYSPFTATVLGSVIVAACLVGYAAVWMERRASLSTVRGRLANLLNWPFGKAPSFRSAPEALYWFEWRRRGRLLPLATLIVHVVLLFGTMRTGTPDLGDYTIACVISLFLGSITAGVANMLLDYRDQSTGLATFTMTRSLSTRSIARARMKMAARSVTKTYLLLFVGLLVWLVLTGTAEEFVTAKMLRTAGYAPHHWADYGVGGSFRILRHNSWAEALPPLRAVAWSGFLILMGILGHATLTWAVLSFFGPLLLTAILVYGGGILAYIVLNALGLKGDDLGVIMACTVLILPAVLLGSQVLWAYRAGRRRGLSGPSGRWRDWWPITAACASLLALTYLTVGDEFAHAGAWGIAGFLTSWVIVSLACVAPVVGMPVWVHWLRHR